MRRDLVRPAVAAVVAFLLAVTGLAYAAEGRLAAQTEAIVVLATTLETPVLEELAAFATREPTVTEVRLAGAPTTVARPAGDGPWPALLVVNGATPKGRREPALQRLARGLARAGYLVAVPDLPGLTEGALSERTLETAVGSARDLADRPDTRNGKVGLLGVSVGTSLALLAAADPSLAGRVTVVTGSAPFADLTNVLRLATTGYHRRGKLLIRYETEPFVAVAAARSLAAQAPALELPELADDAQDPLAPLRSLPGDDPALELLANRDPRRFDELYAALPAEVRASLERLSPLTYAARLTFPIELASAPRDKYFPIAESEALAGAAPDARVTTTSALSHAVPEPSLADLPDLLRFDGWVVRSLRAARSD
jgi:dienelactone hydrolase